jgi:hypothetical protein
MSGAWEFVPDVPNDPRNGEGHSDQGRLTPPHASRVSSLSCQCHQRDDNSSQKREDDL